MLSFFGYAKIYAKGLNIERFLNDNISNSIPMDKLNRRGYTEISFYVPITSYKRTVKNAQKYDIRLESEFGGLIAAAFGSRQRWIFVCGLFVVLAVIIMMSGCILTIEINGSESLDEFVLRKTLSDIGVVPLVRKDTLDITQIKNKLKLAYPDVAYIDCEVQGVLFKVEVFEGIAPPEIADTSRPADIVAKKDAYIESMIAKAGMAVVSEGETVIAGQKLISGTIGGLGEIPRYYFAQGSVKGNVWYSAQAQISVLEYTETGNNVIYKNISLGKLTLDAREKVLPYEKYKMRVIDKKVYFENFFIPLKILTEEYYEVIETATEIEPLKKTVSNQAFMRAMEQIPSNAEILDVSFNYNIEESNLIATCQIKTSEEIGMIRYLD